VRYLLLSDLHANRHALEAVLEDAEAAGYDATLVLGDLVGYGADPEAVIDRTLALAPMAMIRGNHDKVCAGLEPADQFNEIARRSIEWTTAVLSPGALRTLAFLAKGPQTIGADIEISHGAPFDEDFYIFDLDDAARALDSASARWSFFGHTHVPALFATAEDPIRPATPGGLGRSNPEVLILPSSGPALINVGSVGQPRDGDPRAAYGLLDVETGTLTLKRVAYDVSSAQARIRQEGLPPYLAERLGRGQ
jgi:predicted phosphodiesterase